MIRLVYRGLRFHWRLHASLLPAIALAGAVITATLLAGDCVRGSLREIALQRLGAVRYALHTPHRFLDRGVADRMSGETAPALLLPGMAIAEQEQVNRVQVIGCDARFWNVSGVDVALDPGEAALGKRLADRLDVREGSEISLRIAKPGLLPREAPLASQQADASIRARFVVRRILDDDEMGRFGLLANQTAPLNVFVDLADLARRLDRPDSANLLLTREDHPDERLSDASNAGDFGISFRREGSWIQLEAETIYLDDATTRAARAIPGAEGTLTYLVNSISNEGRSTPYSFVLAREQAGLAPDEIDLNRWLADQLDAQPGETVRLRWFALTPSGEFEEQSRTFRIRSILDMNAMEIERHLTPEFPGLTDVELCADWDIGLPLDEQMLADEANEAYWYKYGPTPKAVVSLDAGQEMWRNRFGDLTAVRWPAEASPESAFNTHYRPTESGFFFRPVREEALEAVAQAIDFRQLFGAMGLFLVASALLLTGLLFAFGLQRRAGETGILLATGWRRRSVWRLLLAEGSIPALAGSLLGMVGGILFTRLLLFGLSSPWSAAVAHSPIRYIIRPHTPWIGAATGFVCALCAMRMALWRQFRHPPRALLHADFTQEHTPPHLPGRRRKPPSPLVPALLLAAAAWIVLHAMQTRPDRLLLPFFGAGTLLLAAGLLACRALLRGPASGRGFAGIPALALRNITRREKRSLAVIGLLAAGCFVVLSVSSMREEFELDPQRRDSGTGGFGLVGESTLPIADIPDAVRIRVRDGDDAGCLNLNRARIPRILGVDPHTLAGRGAFFDDPSQWNLLLGEDPDDAIPALAGDADTALWGLDARPGTLLEYQDDAGQPLRIRLVGHLPMRRSLFQGTLLIAESNFTEVFPGEGYRMFLFEEDPSGLLRETAYAQAGLDVVPSRQRLLEYHAVESAYLSMFLILGGLGVVTGTLGLGAVALRNMQERRTELAILYATGFPPATLRKLLWQEHGVLLVAGILTGSISAGVAMTPVLFLSATRISLLLPSAIPIAMLLCGALCIEVAVRIALRDPFTKTLREE